MGGEKLRGTRVTLPVIPRQNNIGLLRLLFAFTVLLNHLYALSLAPALQWLQPIANAELAVQGFFVLSGFLVVMSYENSKGWRDYASKRIRRIYPAYAAVVVLCASIGGLLGGGDVLRYLAANLVFLNFLAPEMPPLFASNPVHAVNGALWTIKIEVMFYALVPLLVWLLRGRRRLPWIAAIYAGSLAYQWVCERHGLDVLGHQLPGQMCYFIGGATLYYYFGWAMAQRQMLLLFAIAACALGVLTPYDALYPAGVAVLVILAAFGPYLGNSERHGDFSYGLYIWHFPVIQLLVMWGYFANPFTGAAIAILLTGLIALASWRWVEKPALRKSSHYVKAATA